MNTPLTLFTDPAILARTNRTLLTRFLEDYQTHLPPDAAALLAASLNSLSLEEYCSAWAKQFGSTSQFGAPLVEALHAIEFLALPENAAILGDALSHLPPGYEINRGFSTLHQALHLWMLAHSPAGVPWPGSAAEPREERREEAANSPSSSFSSSSSTAPLSDAPDAPKDGPFSFLPSPISSADASAEDAEAAAAAISNLPSPISQPPAPDAPHAPAAALDLNSQPSTLNGSLSQLPSPISQPPAPDAPHSPAAAVPLSTLNPQLSTPNDDDDDDPAADAKADAVPLRRLAPWPDPIPDAPALFDQVHDRALHYLFLPRGAAVLFTLWPGHSHAVKAFTHSPRLYVTSTEPGCGKTTALDFIACLCPAVLRTDNLKPAVLFRVTHKHEPTLVLDEFDSYAHQYPDLRGLINAGHNLHGCATRCEGPNVRFFKAYSATAIAGIGDLAPTLAQRSIVIRLTRAPAGALHARFDRRHTKVETTLGRKIARWVQDNYAAIAACDPVMPPEVINRLADNWRPLFTLAQVIGGHWPQRLLEAFHHLQPANLQPLAPNSTQPSSTADSLLADVRQVFADSGSTRLFAGYLVRALRALANRPWAHAFNGSKPLTEIRLSRYLASLGIYSKTLRISGRVARGYLLADFASQLLAPDYEI